MQVYEVVPAEGGTYILHIYNVSMTSIGSYSVPLGRNWVQTRTYPSINALTNDLKLIVAAPPIS